MIRVTDGNAFTLSIQAEQYVTLEKSEAVSLGVVDNLIVNLVRRGIPTALDYGIDSNGFCMAICPGTLACGVYSLELTGYFGGQPWRHYGRNVLEIVRESIDGSPDDIYELPIKVVLGGVLPPSYLDASIEKHNADEAAHPYILEQLDSKQEIINTVEATVDDESDEPSANVDMEGGKMVFAFHGIKGKDGVDGNDGEPGPQGPIGPMGDSAVYGAGDLPLANVLGGSTVKGMTQKAISDAYIDAKVHGWSTVSDKTQQTNVLINPSTSKVVGAASGGRIIYIEAHAGEIYRVVASGSTQESGVTVGLIASVPPAVGDDVEILAQSPRPEGASTADIDAVLTVNSDGYLGVSLKDTTTVTFYKATSVQDGIEATNAALSAQRQEIEAEIGGIREDVNVKVAEMSGTSGAQILWSIMPDTGKYRSKTASNQYTAYGFPLTAYRGKTIVVTPDPEVDAEMHLAFLSAKGSASGDAPFCEGCSLIQTSSPYKATVPNDAVYLYAARYFNGVYHFPLNVCVYESLGGMIGNVLNRGISIHVNASTGDDSNSGLTSAAPLATFEKALEKSGDEVRIILHGDTTEKLSVTNKKRVSIENAPGEKARIIRGFVIDEATDEGNGIFSKSLEESEQPFGNGRTGVANDKYWIYQHDVPDVRTEITDRKRHPLQRGLKYRCGSTRLVRCESLSALLQESQPSYWFDEANNTLYFRISEGTTLSENPVILPYYDDKAVAVENAEFVANGIECLYGAMVLLRCVNPSLTDCAARFAYGDGCFRWPSSKGVRFTRCEASQSVAGSSETGGGDGFNGHLSGTESVNTADVKRMTATMVDCWSHDCNDDGFSDHSRSETTIIGGLFEHCGKGGITPSFGSCVTIHNAITRDNAGAGVLYTGENSNEYVGKGGSCTAVGCYSEDNGTHGYSTVGGKVGERGGEFIDMPNVLTLIGCMAVNNAGYGYYSSSGTNNPLHVIGCFANQDEGHLSANAIIINASSL